MNSSALALAHDRDQNFIDEDTMLAGCDELELVRRPQDQGRGRRAAHAKSCK